MLHRFFYTDGMGFISKFKECRHTSPYSMKVTSYCYKTDNASRKPKPQRPVVAKL